MKSTNAIADIIVPSSILPEGLLHYENNIIFKLYPLHLGMRWYWRDFESMERWTRSWSDFLRHSGGTGFWHEHRLDLKKGRLMTLSAAC
jgi:hypothetical protein